MVLAGAVVLLVYGLGSGGSSGEGSADAGNSATPLPPGAEASTTTDPAAFIRAYYALAPADPAAAWKLLGPEAQAQSRGFASYQEFYTSLSSVTLVGAPTVDGTNVRAKLRFLKKVGDAWNNELYDFVLTRNPNGSFTMASFERIA